MIKTLLILTGFITTVFCGTLRANVSSDEISGTFQAANVDYLGARYDDAIRKYESLVSSKIFSPSIFFNLANAYYRQGLTGKAIVNYERALSLSPRDPDIRANLKFVTEKEQILTPRPRWFLQFTSYLTINTWFSLSAFFFTLASLLGILRTLKLHIPAAIRKNMILGFLMFFAVFCLGSGFYALRKFQYAIITKPETALTISPVPHAQIVSVLDDGLFVRPIKTHGDYVLVQTFNNQKGWLPKSAVENILTD